MQDTKLWMPLTAILLVLLSAISVSADLVPSTDCTTYFPERDSHDLIYDYRDAYIQVWNEDCSPVNTGFIVRAYQRDEFVAELDKRVPQQETVVFKFEDLGPGVYTFRLFFYTWESEVLKDVIQGVNVAWCGDLVCGNQKEGEEEENCYTCSSDCGCAASEVCDENERQCVHFCGNGIKEYNETCLNCKSDAACENGYLCGREGCYLACGNGMCESLKGEDCWTCTEDCGCLGSSACNVNQQTVYNYVENKDIPLGFKAECVSINTDNNCGFAGNVCIDGEFCHGKKCVQCVTDDDCSSFTTTQTLDSYQCVNGNTALLQQVAVRNFKCDWGTCIGENTYDNGSISCNGRLCQNGACGCEPGYEECFAASECRRKGLIDVGNDCMCDFECSSRVCYNQTCALVLDESQAQHYLEQYGEDNVHLVRNEKSQLLLVDELPEKNRTMENVGEWVKQNWRGTAGYSLLVIAVILLGVLIHRIMKRRAKRQEKGKIWKGDYY